MDLKNQLEFSNQNFLQENTSSLLNEIQRLNRIIQQKDKQIEKANAFISQCQSQSLKINEYVCLIMVLLVEIQRLKSKLLTIETHQQNESQRIRQNLKKQHEDMKKSQDLPNFDIIKEFEECLRNLYSFYHNDKQQNINQEKQLKCQTNSLETHQSLNSSLSSCQNIPSSTSLTQSIILNSHNSIQDNLQQNQQPLYTPIKSQQNNVMTFGKIDESDSLKYSVNSKESQKEFTFQLQSIEKDNFNAMKNCQNKNLSFLSYIKLKPFRKFSNYENKKSQIIGKENRKKK